MRSFDYLNMLACLIRPSILRFDTMLRIRLHVLIVLFLFMASFVMMARAESSSDKVIATGHIANATALDSRSPSPIRPGLWQLVTTPDMPGGMFAIPRISQLCLTSEDIATGRLQLTSAPACAVQGGEWSGNVLRLSVDCAGALANVERRGSLQGSDQIFVASIELNFQSSADTSHPPNRLVYRHSAQWLGNVCPTETK